MKQTILLGNGSISSVTLSRFAYIFIGLVLILNGINTYYSDSLGYFEYGLIAFTLIGGIYAMVYALIALTKFSSLSPKIRLSDSLIQFRSSITKKSKTLAWSEVEKIHFQPYQIDFILNKETIEFPYHSNSKISKRIKDTLRIIAESNKIEITGG